MSDQVLREIGSRVRAEPAPVRRGRNVIAVIGIDDYVHWRKLNNAVGDAQGVRDLFANILGFQEVVAPLFNAEATLEAINSLVLDQLQAELKPEDSLILFFAGHGHTETTTLGDSQVQTGYLIPAGGRLPLERKFGGYLKLDSFLKDIALLPARHVMVILDACYSGFALGQTVTVLRDHERYTDDLDRRVSRHVITSAMHDQPALDSGPVLGHSLFTGALIEALQSGKADPENRGFVTGSELALYVQKAVLGYAQERNARQTPDYGYFEHHQRGELVIALRGETHNKNQARECLEIARRAEVLGRFTGDRKRFAFAAAQYREAIRFAGLAKMAFPEAELGLGTALLAAGDSPAALKTLSEVVEAEGDDSPPESRFYLGMAYAGQKEYAQAAGSLAAWLEKSAADPNAAWVRDYVDWLRSAAQRPAGRRVALLIGIDHYSLQEAFKMNGCVNDVEKLVKPALTRYCGFQADDILTLTDQEATIGRVLAELEKLKESTSLEDTVVVHFSGHSVPSSTPEYFGRNDAQNVYLILHDTHDQPGYLADGITALQLHNLMQAIPAGHKTLVLDTHASHELIELARAEGTYALIVASDTAEVAYEWHTVVDGEEIPCGMLTGALCLSLEKLGGGASPTYADWFIPAAEIASQASADPQYPQRQTPYFVGLLDRRPYGGEDPYHTAFDFVQRGSWPERTVDQLEKQYRLFRHLIATPFPQAHYAYGRAFLSRRAYPQAIAAFEAALALNGDDPEAWLALGSAQARAGDYASARAALGKASTLAKGGATGDANRDLKKKLEALLEPLGRLEGTCRRAVIILMDASQAAVERSKKSKKEYSEAISKNLTALKSALVRQYGLKETDIQVLFREKASWEGILAELERAAEDPLRRPCLFCLIAPPSDLVKEAGDLKIFEEAAAHSGHLFVWVQADRFFR